MEETTEGSQPGNHDLPRILVTGDIVRDHFIYVGQKRRPGSTILDGTLHIPKLGGAGLLYDLLDSLAKVASTDRSFEVKFGLNQVEAKESARSGHCVMAPFPESEKSKKRIWRMEQALGFSDTAFQFEKSLIDQTNTDGIYDILVIDDAGVEYRRRPSQDAWPAQVRSKTSIAPKWIVLKLSSPVAAGDLWHTLVSGTLQDHAPTETELKEPRRLSKNSIAIMSIADLRIEQIHVTKALSWERAAIDLADELASNPHLSPLKHCRFAIVTFGTDGALLADFGFDVNTNPRYYLIFDPANMEGDFAKSVHGQAFGYQCCFTAAIVSVLNQVDPANPDLGVITNGIRAGLAAMRRMLIEGHGADTDQTPSFPFNAVANEILNPKHEWEYSIATVPTQEQNKLEPQARNAWAIVEGEPGGSKQPLFGTARRVALRGPKELRNVPYQRFGDLFTVDRSEIESLLSLRQLITDYVNDKSATKPLSIAVFGAPGSGKSFGVKQLAKAVMGDKVPILEFNLSQFSNDPNELIGLYHQVRDRVLEGKTPVVFWDEFDSSELFWLQFLLAPMQDGKFQVGQESHPIGKCIFVFAGGTSYTYDSFGPKEPDATSVKDELDAWRKFRTKKGPDFKSRLSGYLDVLGPNQRQILIDPKQELRKVDSSDVSYPIRRALLLRVKLGLFKDREDEQLQIDPGLLSAFLEIDRYKHGARSLEKIAEQVCAHSHDGEFHRSDLPPEQQLDLHVDAKAFHARMERDLATQVDVDELAAAIHAYYEASYPSPSKNNPKSGDDPVKVKLEFEELPEFLKEDNRAAARRICEVLGSVGLYLTKNRPTTSSTSDVERIINDNISIMAEAEHEGWVDARRRHGWRHGESTSFQKREHASIRPYANLDTAEQQKDETVRNYAQIVAKRNYFIVPDPPSTNGSANDAEPFVVGLT